MPEQYAGLNPKDISRIAAPPVPPSPPATPAEAPGANPPVAPDDKGGGPLHFDQPEAEALDSFLHQQAMWALNRLGWDESRILAKAGKNGAALSRALDKFGINLKRSGALPNSEPPRTPSRPGNESLPKL